MIKANMLATMAIVMYAVTIVIPMASAETLIDETRTVDSDYYFMTSFYGTEGTKITVDIQVTSGEAIDLFLMNAQDYNDYQNMQQGLGSEFYYYVAGSAMNIKSKKYSWTLPESNTYYVVIDNTDQPADGAYSLDPVDVHVVITTSEDTPIEDTPIEDTPFIGILGTIVAIGIVAILMAIRCKK